MIVVVLIFIALVVTFIILSKRNDTKQSPTVGEPESDNNILLSSSELHDSIILVEKDYLAPEATPEPSVVKAISEVKVDAKKTVKKSTTAKKSTTTKKSTTSKKSTKK